MEIDRPTLGRESFCSWLAVLFIRFFNSADSYDGDRLGEEPTGMASPDGRKAYHHI